MNKNYRKGRAFEYKVKKEYEEAGWHAMRTSGSHGFYDIICVLPGYPVQLIQCKTTQSKTKAQALIKSFRSNPPLQPNELRSFEQILEVHVKGGERWQITV